MSWIDSSITNSGMELHKYLTFGLLIDALHGHKISLLDLGHRQSYSITLIWRYSYCFVWCIYASDIACNSIVIWNYQLDYKINNLPHCSFKNKLIKMCLEQMFLHVRVCVHVCVCVCFRACVHVCMGVYVCLCLCTCLPSYTSSQQKQYSLHQVFLSSTLSNLLFIFLKSISFLTAVCMDKTIICFYYIMHSPKFLKDKTYCTVNKISVIWIAEKLALWKIPMWR